MEIVRLYFENLFILQRIFIRILMLNNSQSTTILPLIKVVDYVTY